MVKARYYDRGGRRDSETIGERLLRERIVFVNEVITGQVASAVVGLLLYLQSEDAEKPISLYINSPGGAIYHGLAIYDTMRHVQAPVHTYAVGVTASMGTVLLASGDAGHRYALPHATIHMHPAGGTTRGYAPDVEIQYKELKRVEDLLHRLLSKHTGQTMKQISSDFERDRYMTAEEAVEYGLVDKILLPPEEEE